MANLLNSFDDRDGDVTVDMMDYKYIDQCSDIKKLEKILRALRSGKEGYYPHLIDHCEDKLMTLNPKSRYLRKENPVLSERDLSSEDQSDLLNGINHWTDEMKSDEQSVTNGFEEKNLPPIRKTVIMTGGNVKKQDEGQNTKKSERIRSGDYKSWDKFDVEEECKKVDEKPVVSKAEKKTSIPHELDSLGMTNEEKEIRAGREKEKGNEAFKAGDYEEALAYYSRSINLVRTAASINNRALTYLRLEKWSDAVDDCNDVLSIEKENLKAKMRRATGLKELGKLQESKEDLEFVIKKEANNARAKKLLSEVEEKLSKKGRKMKITEVDNDDDSEEESILPPVNHQDASGDAEAQRSGGDDIEKQNSAEVAESETQKEKEIKTKVFQGSGEEDLASSLSQKAKEVVEGKKDVEREESRTNLKSSEATTKQQVIEVPQTPLPAKMNKIKCDAGDLYRAGQYGAAADKYTEVINKLKQKMKQHEQSNYSHALATLYNNRAACKLKSGDDKSCISDCDQVLLLKANDFKALTRRASAYEHMEKYKLAYNDFRAAQHVDWTASQAQDGANRVAKHLRELYGTKWRDVTSGDVVKENVNSRGSEKIVTKAKVASAEKSETTKLPSVKSEKPPPESKQIDAKEMKRAKIRKDLFEKLKSEGNSLVKMGNYGGAIDNYTRCIQLCPDEIASYTNRALCYLKTNKPVSADHDCTEAIKLDPRNVKAYYRRAQARKNMELFSGAEQDWKEVLELDPKNRHAASELAAVQKSMKEKRKLKIEEVSDDDDDDDDDVKMTSLSANSNNNKGDVTSPKSKSHESKVRDAESENGAQKSKSAEKEVSASTELSGGGDKGVAGSNEDNVTPFDVPANMTPFEFGNLWNRVQPKDNIALYKLIIDSLVVKDIPVMVSNKITDQMIVVFARLAQIYLDAGSPESAQRAYDILYHLVQAQRFNMAAMFMSKEDKDVLGSTFASLANAIKTIQVDFSFNDVNNLRSLYKL